MAKFTFRLNSVLKLKTQMEDDAKNKLAATTATLIWQEKLLQQFKESNEASVNEFNSETNKGILIHEALSYNNFFSMMKYKIADQRENVNNAQRDVETSRERLVKAVQERKILDKLKEKKYDEHLEEQEKAEQLLIDELNSFKFKGKS